jgi:hypothetical protein
MIIISVNIMGGLGNQLFQIATGYAYARKIGETFQILKITNSGNRPVYWNTILQKLNPYLVSFLPEHMYQWSEISGTLYTEIPHLPYSMYLNGYYQSSKYFGDEIVQQEIKNLFKSPEELRNNVSEKYKWLLVDKDRVVVVHARRTDYLKNEHNINYHGPLTPEYYEKAIENIKSVVSDPIWVFTSDDNSFWESVPCISSLSNVYILNEDSDIFTFTLLQEFHNYIMSNSTFIWWCIWLSNAKKVIAPAQWFGPSGPKQFTDIYEKGWELI